MMKRHVDKQDDKLLTTKQVAEIVQLSPATLVDFRHDSRGPVYQRLGKREIRYWHSDVLKWLDQVLVPVVPTRL